jgi:hypothetical protein
MRKLFFIFILLLFTFVSCEESVVPKPENLIKEKQMIEMLADIHLAEATFTRFRYDSTMQNSTSADFYYTILDKYQIPDSVFERSFVYYASTPKSFEEMYRKVMNKLSTLEQEYSGRKEELLQFEEEEKK